MSNLSEFIGGGIKSVQSGTTALVAPTSLVEETINAVDTAKSFISLNGIRTSSTSVLPCGYVEFVDSTKVRVVGQRTFGTSVTITINWTVVEYY
jgi:hypothetical protein